MTRLFDGASAVARVVLVSVRLALVQVWANKLRAGLTTLGIVIGVGSVVAVVAGVVGLERAVLGEVAKFGADNLFVLPSRPAEGPLSELPFRVFNFKPGEFDGLADAAPGVRAFTRITHRGLPVRRGNRSFAKRITGIDEGWHEVESRAVIFGRPFTLADRGRRAAVCLIDEETRDELRLPLDPTGSDVLIGRRRFTVVGVVEEDRRPDIGGGPPETQVYVPFDTLYGIDPSPWNFVYLAARAADAGASTRAAGEVTWYLRNRRGIRPGDPDTFTVRRVESAIEQVQTIGRVITFAAAAVVGISLVVGGVGIMNIMLVSVSERTREIGLRKALGARPGVILVQFLVEAVVLCVAGGLAGLALGQALVVAVRSVPGSPLTEAAIPVWAVVLALGFSAATGLAFGMFPAIKASRLDPIVALRHE